MKDYVNEHLVNPRTMRKRCGRLCKPFRCKDGTIFSIQASEMHYCSPRRNFGPYGGVEVGFYRLPPFALRKYVVNSEGPPRLLDYLKAVFGKEKERNVPYICAYVPTEKMNRLIEKHGGPA